MIEQQATHFAVPVPVFQAVTKVLGTMPYDQVSVIMQALSGCKPLSIPGQAQPGDIVGTPPDLKAVESKE